MKCEFEEKQFESALNQHLAGNHQLVYATGQVLENTLGFDAALMTHHRGFWGLFPDFRPWYARLFGFGLFPEGLELQREWWQRLGQEIEHFPKLKFNVFIQHKRPSYRTGRTTIEWENWQQPYYKYKLTRHQQQALAQLSMRMGTAGIVVYASPAFYKAIDLWDSARGNSLVEKTSFVEAHRLNNHTSYSYIRGGSDGVGHSAPEKINGPLFTDHLNRLREKHSPHESNKNAIIHWSDIVNSTVLEIKSRKLRKNYERFVSELVNEHTESRLALAFSRIHAFCFLTNSTCFFGVGNGKDEKHQTT
jgi:hypothetical protein